ncbi:hypothetical protein EPUS_05165 [Endocarpon pusillum Z07020]|uniref:Uncharacterized protein n=1 Tax=Endocarpon pusillum (strain Z07020 / HMAS-L-300199) TaxID=1263415 RepID=U1GBM3_ENDPU|nr:uncharacterized protein EPUS_05165 [Endocarpon pusillum Z07020]ERF74957.1 hypothetical protein EPUS_05165 [Endocarpon pusillum Z07020]
MASSNIPNDSSFTWSKTGLGEATFNGLASLTSIRNGGEISSVATNFEDSDELRRILQPQNGELVPQETVKSALLEAFCQLASKDDSACQIASAALIEGKDRCVVVLARNTSFTEEEKKLFQELVTELHPLSQLAAYGPLGLDQTISLRTKILDLQLTQLHDHLIPKTREALRVHVVERTAARPILMTLLSPHKELTNALRSLVDTFQYDASYAASQLLAAFDLAYVPFAKLHLRNIIGDNHITNDLWSNICLLKRLPKAWGIILEALEKLPQLRVLDIVCLQSPNVTSTPHSEPQSLKRTLRRCGLSPVSTALRTNIIRHLSMEQVLALHEKFQRLKPMMHAEVQIITYLLQKGSDGVFANLASSARPCFLCHDFAQQFQLKTRDPVFSQHSAWMVPEVLDIGSDKVNVLIQATRAIAAKLKSQLLIPITATPSNQNCDPGRSGEFKPSLEGNEDDKSSSAVNEEFKSLEEAFARLSPGNSLLHTLDRMHASSGYALYEAAERDEIPKDDEVHHGYGFSKFTQDEDRKMLLGLYRDSANMLIQPGEVNRWRAEVRLVAKIKEKFMQRPEHLRGDHFAWLLRNEHMLVELDMEKRAGEPEHTGMVYFDASPPRLPDTSSTRNSSTAEALWQTIDDGLPGDVDIRRDFGFDRCVSVQEESNLLGLYKGLCLERVDPLAVQAWVIEGKLAENIQLWFEARPAAYRGAYYPWIRRNPHILA